MAKSALGAVLARNVELLRRKFLAPLRLRNRTFGATTLSDFASFAHRWNTFCMMRIYSTEI
jgi:hypothetical protein